MKIDKLRTEKQFIEYCYSEANPKKEGIEDVSRFKVYLFDSIVNYNQFTDCELKPEMFINPIKKIMIVNETNHNDDCHCLSCEEVYDEYTKNQEKWQEAEKKVVFEGWSFNQPDKNKRDNVIFITYGIYQLGFFKTGEIYLDNLKNNKTHCVKTKSDLARATNGELTLKNVEL